MPKQPPAPDPALAHSLHYTPLRLRRLRQTEEAVEDLLHDAVLQAEEAQAAQWALVLQRIQDPISRLSIATSPSPRHPDWNAALAEAKRLQEAS